MRQAHRAQLRSPSRFAGRRASATPTFLGPPPRDRDRHQRRHHAPDRSLGRGTALRPGHDRAQVMVAPAAQGAAAGAPRPVHRAFRDGQHAARRSGHAQGARPARRGALFRHLRAERQFACTGRDSTPQQRLHDPQYVIATPDRGRMRVSAVDASPRDRCRRGPRAVFAFLRIAGRIVRRAATGGLLSLPQ